MNASEYILDLFRQVNTIPRKSKHEDRISAWLVEWARSQNFDVQQDKSKNVYMYIPASPGRQTDPTVILQAHTDMVCEKTPDSTHDFNTDPITHIVEGDWMHADRTTLGADNGIGCALSLALASDDSLSRPPLELLFTVDEETGLQGARNVRKGYLSGRIMINLDSEDEGVFTIGCAGGRDTALSMPMSRETGARTESLFTVSVDGLRGGHSGVDIHEQRENANVLLGRTLHLIGTEIAGMRIADIAGGSSHNAIPRNARAVVAVAPALREAFRESFLRAHSRLTALVKTFEPGMELSLRENSGTMSAITPEDSLKAIRLINALPHGVAKMSMDMENLVETSNNLAVVALKADALDILCSQRSSIDTQLDWIVSKIESIGALAGASVHSSEGYPGWKPDLHSKLLGLCKEVYRDLFDTQPRVEAIHAGLECGIIGAAFGDMEMISLGPTIKNPHSPEEKLFLPSVAKVWEFLKGLMQAIRAPALSIK
jgi:dipeptidase D